MAVANGRLNETTEGHHSRSSYFGEIPLDHFIFYLRAETIITEIIGASKGRKTRVNKRTRGAFFFSGFLHDAPMLHVDIPDRLRPFLDRTNIHSAT